MKRTSMPNESHGHKAGTQGGTNTGKTGGLVKEDSQRADVMATPKTKNPYPKGLS